jgi:molybdate-binding protein/DNA-binding XRE family transcriptional regulator
MGSPPLSQLRRLREARGLTQNALAEAASISRQTLSAIEAGRTDPAVSIGVRLARVLDCRVEDLFAAPEQPGRVQAVLAAGGGELVPGKARVALAFVRERWVAHALPAREGDAMVHAADGVALVAQKRTRVAVELLRPAAEARHTLVLLGCAPALGVLADRLNRTPGAGRFLWRQRASMPALASLEAGHAHLAGVHFGGDVATQHVEANVAAVRRLLPRTPVSVVALGEWQAGLVVRAGNPLGVRGVADLARRGLRIATREAGAGARLLLERQMAAAHVPHKRLLRGALELRGHMEVAHAVAIGAADVGVAMQQAAIAHGLSFIPLASERFDLVLPAEIADDPRVTRLFDTMTGAAFRREVEALGGYDLRQCGRAIVRLPAA